ncbi:hypothetical protein [Wolbachia endosymbiont of Oedothorax gibbosus]|uniref:hypothetical protein n=1 Tax=Wolbachia endosymbiont of Oedothorax gibbosus TaxID=931100 RepID=UPI002025118E|nr:hypothetical protein [Wolbachia endosymbiont of Oedothorax gibbosus]
MFGPGFRDFVSQEQSRSSKILKKSDSRDSGAEEECKILEKEEIKERCHSEDSGNCSEAEEEQSTNGATRSEFQLTQSLLSKVKAGENNKHANSGKQAQLDLKRMNFVINGKTIDKKCVSGLCNKNNHLISNGNEDYRTFAKQVFTGMFKHVEADVPSDNILAELITNCNQAGYECAMHEQIQPILAQYNLISKIFERTISIRCDSTEFVSVEYSEVMHVLNFDNPEEKICESNNLLKFTLKSQDGKVEYKDGKVTLAIPEQLKDYKAGSKSLLGDINRHFEDADNAVVESLVENIGEGPKSFVADPPAEVDSDSFNIIPEGEILNLDHIPELVKKAVDDKDVNALATHISFFQDRVNRISPQEGLSVVEKTLKIISDFAKKQGKAWNTYPAMPGVSHVYSAKQHWNGYISQADYEKVKSLEDTLCKIKSSLIKRSSNDPNERSPVKNAQDTSATLNETPILSQAVSREQLNTKESKNQQLQRNIVDKGENIMNNEKASVEEAMGNNYRSGKMGKNKKSIKQGLSIDVIYDVERMKNFLESNDDKLVLKEALNQVNNELTKKENTKGLDLAKKKKRINQKKRLTEAKELLTEKISNIEMNAKTAASSVNDVSATTSSQAAPVSEDVSQDIRSEILVPSSSVSPDVGNVSTAENINDNMVASKNSGQVNDVQSGDEQPDSPPLSPQSSASGDVEDTEASANAAVTIPEKVDSLVSDGENGKIVSKEHQDDALEKDFSNDDGNSFLGDPVPTSTNEISGRTDGTQNKEASFSAQNDLDLQNKSATVLSVDSDEEKQASPSNGVFYDAEGHNSIENVLIASVDSLIRLLSKLRERE